MPQKRPPDIPECKRTHTTWKPIFFMFMNTAKISEGFIVLCSWPESADFVYKETALTSFLLIPKSENTDKSAYCMHSVHYA